MKIMVTGGAGYIGSHTANKLLQAGHEVTIYDNLSTGFSEALPKQCKFVMGDVRDAVMLGRVMKDRQVEAVLHFAAKTIVPESISEPVDYYENNTVGVLSLVKACRAQGVKKVVFSSSAAVYGSADADGVVHEEMQMKPLTPYGRSKAMSEEILRDAEFAYGIRAVSLRYFNVAGAASDGSNGARHQQATLLVKVAAETAAGKRPSIDIYGSDYATVDGTCIRDFIHVEDLADLHILALDYLNEGSVGTVFNCGYGHGFSVREVITMMKKVSGAEMNVIEKPRRLGDAPISIADVRKAKTVLKWQPRFDDLEVICRSAFNWEKRS